MKEVLCNNALFGIVLCAAAWQAGVWVNEKLRTPLAHPLLVGIVLAVSFLAAFGIPLDWFRQGGQIISLLLAPATAALGLSVWRQRAVLQKKLLAGGAWLRRGQRGERAGGERHVPPAGAGRGADKEPFAPQCDHPHCSGAERTGGGLPSVTTLCAVHRYFGHCGRALSCALVPAGKRAGGGGVAIGTSSHVIGTTAAMGLGEVQGAMSSVSIGVAGLLTVALALVW